MSPPSYEDVLDYVDTQVTYAENKREVLAVFGERSRSARISNKDLQEMHCTSLHNECASNGLETCQVACDECNNPAACEKAERIEKEIKKHGRELTGFERMQTAHEKEAKRVTKKAKFSVGQTVKCREGYELQCGFSGAQKITQVKAYPDYVMYGIQGKPQGFVEEDWVERVKVKPPKPALKEKKTVKTTKPPEPKIVELGRDIPRWVKIKNKKYFFSRSFSAKKEADIWAGSIRKDKRLAHVKKYKPFIFYLSSSKTPQRYIVWATSPYEVEKPPKPTPTKATKPSKKKKAKSTYRVVKTKRKVTITRRPEKTTKTKPSKITLHPKTLTDAQIKHARKHGYVNVTIDGVKKRVTKRNYALRKRTVQWYRSGGKVCLKVVRG